MISLIKILSEIKITPKFEPLVARETHDGRGEIELNYNENGYHYDWVSYLIPEGNDYIERYIHEDYDQGKYIEWEKNLQRAMDKLTSLLDNKKIKYKVDKSHADWTIIKIPKYYFKIVQ